MKLTLKIWRQKDASAKGSFQTYQLDNLIEDMSFLEAIDVLNEDLIKKGEEPVQFDNDCREGICGACSMYINGRAHGPQQRTTACQLHLRVFEDGETVTVEPWRAKAFPIVKDLVVDRSAFDRIIQAGGYVSVNTGGVPDANNIPIPKEVSDKAFDAATCISCGACVATCKNGSASLFVGAKIAQLALLPQGQVERQARAEKMVAQMDAEGFGSCSNTEACSAECPVGIPQSVIAMMNKEYFSAKAKSEHVKK